MSRKHLKSKVEKDQDKPTNLDAMIMDARKRLKQLQENGYEVHPLEVQQLYEAHFGSAITLLLQIIVDTQHALQLIDDEEEQFQEYRKAIDLDKMQRLIDLLESKKPVRQGKLVVADKLPSGLEVKGEKPGP